MKMETERNRETGDTGTQQCSGGKERYTFCNEWEPVGRLEEEGGFTMEDGSIKKIPFLPFVRSIWLSKDFVPLVVLSDSLWNLCQPVCLWKIHRGFLCFWKLFANINFCSGL